MEKSLNENSINSIEKQTQILEKFLSKSGFTQIFKIIFAEIIQLNLNKEEVFPYTIKRIRQIGQDLVRIEQRESTFTLTQHENKYKKSLQKQRNKSDEYI